MFPGNKAEGVIMKKLWITGLVLACLFCFCACDDGGGDSDDDEDVNEATGLGDTLDLSGTIEQVFDTVAQSTESYTTGGDDDYRMVSDNDDTRYALAEDTDRDGDIDIKYDLHEHNSFLFDPSDMTGITSSEETMMTGIHVLVYNGGTLTAGEDELFYGDFSGTPARWYDYFYVTIETVLEGTYTDPDSGYTYTFDNIRFFSGWNRVIKETSDGEAYTFTTGTIDNGKWTYMDNPSD